MGRRIRAFDWSKTPLGATATWSPALRMMVSFLLANRFPLLLWWGPQYVSIYNDAYRPVLGAKHPWALGQPVSECWKEIWHILQPLIDTPFHGGPATWNDDIQLELNRHGFVEETHFTIAYSPVPDETVASGIGGVLATVHEITGKVIGDRRVQALRDLGAQSGKAKTAEEACAIAAETLAAHPLDVPFALLYLIDPDRRTARVAGTAGIGSSTRAVPPLLSLEADGSSESPWPLAESMRTEMMETVTSLAARMGGEVPPGPWTDPPDTAVVVPIPSNKAHWLAGFLVAGVSSRLKLDDSYRDFLTFVSSQIATSIANAREYEEEKKRAEALAEIDRAKTAFFSNVSHEFRTPLTLMLGPIEDLLSGGNTKVPADVKGQLEVAHRNSLRLLRLVNMLLDFARIEAGRAQAVFEPTDLAAFTSELASVFHAATERAGLRLTVDCPPLGEPVYVDREMWEKILLNLVSNAFKFTFEGEIAVTLRSVNGAAELRVRDTGVGIPAEEIPRLFERFHRAPTTRSRTHEGSGIGLALVQELVKLHGGSVRVESRLGEGSTFIVRLPLGNAHLPPEHIGGTRASAALSPDAAPFVEEAMGWLPESAAPANAEPRRPPPASNLAGETDTGLARVLVAEDNADMRSYVARLLRERFSVQTVADGAAALEAARAQKPDLILSDVMMPRLDGISLLKALRADAALSTVPVILLSARAGEESELEGLAEGADDYLVKPFTARELLARTAAHIELARLRKQSEAAVRESEARFRSLFEHMLEGFAYCRMLLDDQGRPDDFIYIAVNEAFGRLTGLKDVVGKRVTEVFPRIKELNPEVFEIYGRVSSTGKPEKFEIDFKPLDARLSVSVYSPAKGSFVAVFDNITEKKRNEERLRQSQKLESIGLLAGGIAHDFNNLLIGVIGNASLLAEMIPPYDPTSELVQRILKTGEQLAHLTRQMLAYSGKGRFFLEILDASTVIHDLADLLRPSIPKKVTLLFDLAENLPRIEADRGQLQQILMNLVINAAEAIGGSDGAVTVATRAQIVDAAYKRAIPDASDLEDGEYVVIEVRDNGSGMDDTVKTRIFDPFFSTKFTGRGLGLAAVHGIVRGHEGAILVSSEPGKGSTFTVLFPSTGRNAERRTADVPKTAQGSGVVLVVDDEAVVRNVAKGALERRGYRVLVAYDGLAAIDICKRHPGNIDVAVLDLSMPGMSGEETLPELRKIRPDVKVLVSSGYSEAEAMTVFKGQRVSGFVQKPYTAAILAEKIKRAME